MHRLTVVSYKQIFVGKNVIMKNHKKLTFSSCRYTFWTIKSSKFVKEGGGRVGC